MGVAPSKLRGRARRVTWLYEDPEQPGRVTGTVEAPEWTEDDRAVLLGLEAYEATLCGGCGQPKHVAWHRRTDGEWEAHRFLCHACSAREGREVVLSLPVLEMPAAQRALMDAEPFDLYETTTEPTKASNNAEGG